MIKKVVFTDIDGTLTDIKTGELGDVKDLIRRLKNRNIPVILCSAKTRAEQIKIRRELGLTEPFIVENGGGIVIPKDYFGSLSDMPNHKEVKEYDIIELGKPAREIRLKLLNIRNQFKFKFIGVADLSIESLCHLTDMPPASARRMAQREYGETVLQIDRRQQRKFAKVAEQSGLKTIYGGRFFDVTIGNDKGKAVGIMINLYKKKYYKDNVKFFGVGDSQNDSTMLRLMDVPMLVQGPEGTWSNLNVKNIIKIPAIGPNGWKFAYNKVMGRLNADSS
jgi:mannosyl-3-phosphoglycerate phosphatase family protein